MKEQVIVRLRDVIKAYGSRHDNVVLNRVNAAITKGNYVVVMGNSGAGKSTLFRLIGGIEPPTGGAVYIDEVDINDLNKLELFWLRSNKIGYVFQPFKLIMAMPTLENITFPTAFSGVSRDPQEIKHKALSLLQELGLGDKGSVYPAKLSWGEQQRVALARSLMNDPVLLIADEPTSCLDIQSSELVMNLLKRYNRENGMTVITMTRDMKMLNVADNVIWMRDGTIDRIGHDENFDINTTINADDDMF